MTNIMDDYKKWKDERKYQVMDELTAEEYAELKADIKAHGIVVPVEIDQDGNVIDGHNRVKIAEELKAEGTFLEIPLMKRTYTSEKEKREMAYNLNLKRRHLDREGKRKIIERMLKEFPEKSNTAIGNTVGADHKTVGTIRNKLETTGEIPKLDKTVGQDGRARTTTPVIKKNKITEVPVQIEEVVADMKEELIEDTGEYLKVGKMSGNVIRTTSTLEGHKARAKKVCPEEYIDKAIEAINTAKISKDAAGWEAVKGLIETIVNGKVEAAPKEEILEVVDIVENETSGEPPKVIVEPRTKTEQIKQKLEEMNKREEERILNVIEEEINKVAGAIKTPIFADFLKKAVKAKLKEFGDTLNNANDKDRQDFVNAWNVIKQYIER